MKPARNIWIPFALCLCCLAVDLFGGPVGTTAQVGSGACDRAGGAVTGAAAFSQSKLKADRDVIDFGTVLTGESVSRRIRLTNSGTEPLYLSRIGFTCGCAVPRIILPSGEILKLENTGHGPGRPATGFRLPLERSESCFVELDFTPISVAGHVTRRIFFYAEGAETPALTLPVTAEVKPAFTLEPRRIDFGRVAWSGPVERTLTIRSAGAGDFAVTEIKGLPPFFDCRAARMKDAPAPTWMLTLTLKRRPPPGLQKFILIAGIENDRIDSLKIYGSAVIEPDVVFKASPGSAGGINFGVIGKSEGASAEVEIVNRNGDVPYEIDEVKLESPWSESFEHRLHTIVAGRHYRLFLKLKPGMGVRFFRGKIVFLSDHPTVMRKEVPFKGWINLAGPPDSAEEEP